MWSLVILNFKGAQLNLNDCVRNIAKLDFSVQYFNSKMSKKKIDRWVFMSRAKIRTKKSIRSKKNVCKTETNFVFFRCSILRTKQISNSCNNVQITNSFQKKTDENENLKFNFHRFNNI